MATSGSSTGSNPPRLAARDRLEGGIYGLLIGDALGVPYEFKPPQEIPPEDLIEMQPPTGYRRSHGLVPPGTYSDDGAQALCLLSSLLDRGQLDLADFSQRLLSWFEHGCWAVDAKVFDVGRQTGRALRLIRGGSSPEIAGGRDEQSNGNGSLMRVLPLALWHQGTDDELVRDAHRSSLPTHAHPRAQTCCALYCLWARHVLSDDPSPYEAAVDTLRAVYRASPEFGDQSHELLHHVLPTAPVTGSGYVVDSLRSAFQVNMASSYESVVRRAIRLGNDTDTTAAIAGGIAGLRVGLQGIPERWRSALRGDQAVRPLVDALVSRSASPGV